MSADKLRVELLVDPDGRDTQQTSEDTILLGEQLRQLDLESVQALATDDLPQNARAVDAFDAGSLMVVAAGSRLILKSLFGLIQDWLARRQSGAVKIKIDDDELTLTYASKSAQKQALDAFISRHVK